jgi:hypothetical protein
MKGSKISDCPRLLVDAHLEEGVEKSVEYQKTTGTLIKQELDRISLNLW